LFNSYNQLIEGAQAIENLKGDLRLTSERLSCSVEIILTLLRIKFKLNQEEFDILRSHLSPKIDDVSEHGWEEMTNTAMTNLLKTCLAKTGKQNLTNISSQIK